MDKLSCDKRKDPVSRLVRDLTPSEVVSWMVQFHGLPVESAETVETNLRSQFKYHRLQGRLDRNSGLAILAELWKCRQTAKILERSPEKMDFHTLEEDFAHFLTQKGMADLPDDVREKVWLAYAENWTPSLA